MLSNTKEHQNEVGFVCLEDLVPEDHLHRKIDKYIDSLFILDNVTSYYWLRGLKGAIEQAVLIGVVQK